MISKKDIIDKIKNKCMELYGKSCRNKNFYLVRFNGYKGILRCKNTEKDNAIKLLKKIENINNKKIKIKTVGTSGTIKSLLKKHLDKY